jgi:hypothetical protein
LKLALIGTHGVGKTTLAYEVCSLLKKAHHNVELVTEVALHAQIAAELEASLRAPIVITDRAVLDNYCYLVNKFGRQLDLEAWLGWWMASYSLLVGVPPVEEAIPRDGFRSEDRAFQLRIHELLIELLASPPFNNLPARAIWLDAEERTNWAHKIVSASVPLIQGTTQDTIPSKTPTILSNKAAR